MSRILGEHFRADGKPKRAFLSKRQAEEFIARHDIKDAEVYPCTFCKKHHLATVKDDEKED